MARQGGPAFAPGPPCAMPPQARSERLCDDGRPASVPVAMPAVVVHCSCPDAAIATRIARVLVDERLAACVQAIPAIASTYRWQGEVRTDDEALLLVKTTRARLDALKARITELHPYEVPELVALEVADGTPAYLAWIEAATADGAQ